MTRKIVHYAECDYHREPQYVLLRMAERAGFPAGEEVAIEFRGRDPFEGFGMARLAAMVYAGIASPTGRMDVVPFVAEFGPYAGHVLGSQTLDTRQGWRIDWAHETDAFHVNWWDRRLDLSPNRGREKSKHYYGANYVTGGARGLFCELEAHFPGQVTPKRR